MVEGSTNLTTLELQVLAARHFLYVALDGSELVDAGVALLLAGDESAAVVELAGLRRDDGPVAICLAFDRVLRDRDAVVDSPEAAATVLARAALMRFMAEKQSDVLAITSEIACYNHHLPAGLQLPGVLAVFSESYEELERHDPRRAEFEREAFAELAMLAARFGVA